MLEGSGKYPSDLDDDFDAYGNESVSGSEDGTQGFSDGEYDEEQSDSLEYLDDKDFDSNELNGSDDFDRDAYLAWRQKDIKSDELKEALGSLDKDILREIIRAHHKKQDNGQDRLLKRYENSVFKVFIHAKQYDYDRPYMPAEPMSASGSGFVIMYEGKPYLMTNAHVADSTTLLEIRLADDTKKYPAKVRNVDHDCDLALLEVDDEDFWDKAVPLELGEMPNMQQKLQVYGFPMGGSEFCITEGQVSRIEVDTYAQSGVQLLQTQVTAAINPGNSGGPAIHDGKILGVAFQGYNVGDLLGYIIPPPVMKHFLQDAISPGPYKGFPDLAIEFQKLENPKLRKLEGMQEDQTGIRIKRIAPLSSAAGILKVDDILLELDGHRIRNDGTIALDFAKRLSYNFLINDKQIGDKIAAKVLRDGKELELEFYVTNRANTTYKSGSEYDKAPTYYITSGLVFMPLTDNFMDDASGFFSRVSIDLEKYSSQHKKELDEEVVFIHSALPTQETKDTLGYSGCIISEVNGRKIKNLRDAIEAFESNTDKPHVILTEDKNKLVVDNLSTEQNRQILDKFGITKDRSDDLLAPKHYRPGCPEGTAFLPGFEQIRAQMAWLKPKSEQEKEEIEQQKQSKQKLAI